MKRKLSIAVVLALAIALFGAAFAPSSLAVASEGTSYIVVFDDSVPADFDAQVAALGGTVDFSHPVGIAIVSGLAEADAASLGALAGVENVQTSGYFEMEPVQLAGDAVAIDALPESPSDPTTAARYAWQWNMRAIDADLAWAEGRLGSPEVTVAILDTGIDYTYPDLAGLVDLSRSISFVPEDDALVDVYFPGRHYITDLHIHGTHVAATVASNGYATAGVTSQTTLMGVKVCSFALGYCPDTAVVPGILWAVDNGADVINMSLGGYFNKNEEPGEVGFINRLLNYANSQGVTVVVSAGNESSDIDHNGNEYKTYCDAPNTICVSATGPVSADDIYAGPWYEIDAPAYYTNYGRSAINVAAPGGSSGGYVWAACSTSSLYVPGCQTGIYVIGMGGTSMAAPHVTGTAALIVEDVGRRPGRVVTILQNSADDLGQRGVDPFYGKGRLNVFEAVR